MQASSVAVIISFAWTSFGVMAKFRPYWSNLSWVVESGRETTAFVCQTAMFNPLGFFTVAKYKTTNAQCVKG